MLLLVLIVSLFACVAAFSGVRSGHKRLGTHFLSMISKGIEVIRATDVTEEMLTSQSIKTWPTWGCDASTFPWSYDSTETCYLLKGDVTVKPDDSSLEEVSFSKGDIVTLPKGMSCTWIVKEAVLKHYNFAND